MKQSGIFVVGVALGLFGLLPATALADQDELDVTMEVLDNVADIDGHVIVMPEPEHDGEGSDGIGHERDDGELADRGNESDSGGSGERTGDESGAEHDFAGDGLVDDFTHDEDFESDDDEEHSEDESDFDDGDEIDLDEPEEEPVEDDEPMHDEEQIEDGEVMEGLEGDMESDAPEDELAGLLAGSNI